MLGLQSHECLLSKSHERLKEEEVMCLGKEKALIRVWGLGLFFKA